MWEDRLVLLLRASLLWIRSSFLPSRSPLYSPTRCSWYTVTHANDSLAIWRT